MNARFASLAAALTLSFGAALSPTFAQARTFNAWGHEFSVPGGQSQTTGRAAGGRYTTMNTDVITGATDARRDRSAMDREPRSQADGIWGH